MERKKLIENPYFIAMTVFLFSLFSIITFPTKLLAAPKMILGSAPFNPAYTEYIDNAHSNSSKDVYSLNPSNNNYDYVPSPFSLVGTKPKNIEKTFLKSSSLPTSYDLRTKNKLTAVKDQGSSNSGWAFATYGSLESALETAESDDFSENNLKNRAGFDIAPNAAGNADMSIAYLARWGGPVSEKDDPYDAASTSSPEKPTQKHVQEVLKFGYDNNYNDLKNAIMKYGAVFTTMYYQDENYDSKNTTYYYKGSESANHAVDIVGWNDNFDKNKFAETGSGIPPENGAFIVRNSRGSGWGDKGYFYVSYFDSLIGLDNAVFNNAEPISNYSSIYQYDPLGETTSVRFPSNPNTVWFANVFTAESNDALSAVSFYTNGPNSEYEVWLYAYNNGTLTPNKRLGSGSITYAGYHTIKLSNGTQLTSGSKFAVAVKLTTPSETKDDDPYLLALEEPVSGYSSQAESSKGQSFVSGDGSSWIDLKDTDHPNANVCLKAFTSPKNISSLKADQNSLTIVQGQTQSISVQAKYSDGTTENVTSLIEAKTSNSDVANVSDGKIEAIGPGKATLTLTYLNKTATIKVTVIPTFELKPSQNPITVEETNSVKIKVTAAYSTGKSEDISNKVTWVINPFETQYVSVNKGTITGLSIGNNNITVSYLGQSLTLPVNVIAPLTALTVTPDTLPIATGDQCTPQVFATSGKQSKDVSTTCSAVSSKPSVASIANGVITGGSPGTAVITYTYGSKSAALKVTVSPKLTKLEPNETTLTIKENKSSSIKLTAYYSNGKKADVTKKATWTISPGGEKYISVSNGKITGLSTGTTQINVSYEGQTAVISVSVIAHS